MYVLFYTLRRLLLICCLTLIAPAAICQTKVPYTEVYTNGKTKIKGLYVNGLKHKNWYYYNPTGSLAKREQYKAGVLKNTFIFNNGRLASITDASGKTTYKPGCGCQ